jgi:hypothetical protein
MSTVLNNISHNVPAAKDIIKLVKLTLIRLKTVLQNCLYKTVVPVLPELPFFIATEDSGGKFGG